MEPVKLVRNEQGICKCPCCGNELEFVEAQPVRVIDGKLNIKDSEAHFKCGKCGIAFRRLVHTEYFQGYSE